MCWFQVGLHWTGPGVVPGPESPQVLWACSASPCAHPGFASTHKELSSREAGLLQGVEETSRQAGGFPLKKHWNQSSSGDVSAFLLFL